MCGICGTVGFNKEPVEKMAARMVHRGPDNTGIWNDKNVCLGHTRLSIIDLSSFGNQPMANEDESMWITYNGEIYNFLELREDLEAKGHVFRSNTDTETALHLYEEYGEECLLRLRGMFAFAIYDLKKKKMFAARDRLGIKPLIYYFKDGRIVFASELKALLCSGLIERKINLNSLRDYLSFGSVQEPETLIEDVQCLMPSHYLIFEKERLCLKQYWGLPDEDCESHLVSEADHVRQIRNILDESVNMRMVSDVPLGAFLSGGIDSSAIVALMQKHSNKKVKTYTVTSDEKEYSERIFADQAAKAYNTDHTNILLTEEDIIKQIPGIFDAMDQPSIDGFNTYVVSRAVKESGLTVAFSGLGGDELFAGYPLFRRLPGLMKLINRIKWLPDKAKASAYSALGDCLPGRRYKKLLYGLLHCGNIEQLYRMQHSSCLPDEVASILPGEFFSKSQQGNCVDNDMINHLSRLELKNYVLNTLLTDTDRMSMANSLEVRVPFLDHMLVEKLLKVPGGMKVGTDFPKRLLVKAMGDLLPQSIVGRTKMGFVLPLEKWLRTSLRDYCQEKFSEDRLNTISFIDKNKVRTVWNGFLQGSGRYNYLSVLNLVSFINWHEKVVLKCQEH